MQNYCKEDYKIKIEIHKTKNKCKYFKKIGEEFSIKDIIPNNLCIHAYHSVYPYFLTLINDGWFRWVKNIKFQDRNIKKIKDNEALIVRCPNPTGGLIMKVFPQDNNDKKIIVKVIDKKGDCPKHKIGDKFEIDKEAHKFCPKLFDVIYPYINILNSKEKLTQKEKTVFINCPNPYIDVIVKLQRK